MLIKNLKPAVASAIAVVSALAPALSQTPPLPSALHYPNAGRGGMVVAEEKLAAEIGAQILADGGNAVDAAVATAFALSVTFPRAGNIGGGGFMMAHLQKTGETIAIDYRETAPAAATREMYLNADGLVDEESVLYTHKAAGVPGTVAGLLHALENYGTMSRKDVMAPAIRLAAQGYPIPYFNAAMLAERKDQLSRNEAAKAEFYKPDGTVYLPGETIKRKNLARSLKSISQNGREGFYKGWVAKSIVDDMAANGGLITQADLDAYEVKERAPLIGDYRGYTVHAMPPPSSGGIMLLQMLEMLETRPAFSADGDSAPHLHFLAEVMRRSYADRAEHMGDADFVDVPVQGLIAEEYARMRVEDIDDNSASTSSNVFAGAPPAFESPDTTQISVIDKDGNMVSNTYTLNLSFGSGIVVPGTGILLNNEMDDFAAAPGALNSYGLVGSEANAIAPGKRPLSSMTPTLVFKDGEAFMAIGAPGGARIITAVLQVLLNVIDRGMNIGDATDRPRIHHQWLPDQLLYEPGLSEDTKDLLTEKGHEIAPFEWYARPQTALVEDGWFYGYTDERMPGGGACAPDAAC